ncbi:hypothetical protein AMTRI_Chr01g107700 [Amborella trichopoda]
MGAMEAEDIEAVLERVWDLHDKISDAIHFISKTHLLNSISKPPPINTEEDAFSPEKTLKNEEQNNKFTNGFVFMKKENQAFDTDGLVAEARSLNAIRTALEDLEDQLEFFHNTWWSVEKERRVDGERKSERRERAVYIQGIGRNMGDLVQLSPIKSKEGGCL